MSKKRPPYIKGHYYHFYNRGSHRLSIFHEANDYTYLLRHFKTYAHKFQIAPISYSLLPNHYHMCLRQDGEVKAGVLIQHLFNRYGKTYRQKYNHSGTIFEGPYKVKIVTDESYLLHLCRYIHANPVKHGIIQDIADWPYSNYQEWLGIRQGTLVDRQFIADHFPHPGEYEEFVRDYLLNDTLPDGMDDYLFY
jgi:putative transposase